MPIAISDNYKGYKTEYSKFRGVDFSKDPYLVDKSRSPDALNIYSDIGGEHLKRPGYHLFHSFDGKINSLAFGVIGEREVFGVHSGDKLYIVMGEDVSVVYTGLSDERSSIFFARHGDSTKLFLLTGREYIVYNGVLAVEVEQIATVPVVLIAKNPDGGGEVLQAINMLTPRRIEKFAGDGSSKNYKLGAAGIDVDTVKVTEILEDGERELIEGTNFSVDRDLGEINFSIAPPVSPVTGEDNIFIEYSKTISGYKERICGCKVYSFYGYGGNNRLFVTGNESYREYDFYSEHDDPCYFPDLNYSRIGNNNTKVMGYLKIGEYLLIIKEDNGQDTSIFIRSATVVDGVAIFPIKSGITGVGAISHGCFASLIDEPMFLARTGIYAVTSNNISTERVLKNRSYYINPRLSDEENLEEAVGCEYSGYYFLFVNNHVYLLNSREKSDVSVGDDFVYECYYWDSIPAYTVYSNGEDLFFGTKTGEVYKFNFNNKGFDRYSDNGKAISCYWTTNQDDDGYPTAYKNLVKKGSAVVIKSAQNTSANIEIAVDGDSFKDIQTEQFTVFSWDNINFNKFSFYFDIRVKQIYLKSAVKKYRTLQFRVSNSRINEGFGLYEIIKQYRVKNYAREG